MLTTLDLACPIAWKSAAGKGSSTLSPTPLSKRTIISSHSIQDDSNDEEWLQRRYYETLWLGEEHSPLLGFLQHLRRFERKILRQTNTISQLVTSFSKLLKSRKQIRQRFTAATSATKDGNENENENAVENMIRGLLNADDDKDYTSERELVMMALQSGPATLVSAELRRIVDKTGDAKMTRSWLKAIESRELQVQILLVLNLLRLSTKAPVLTSASTSISAGGSPPEANRDCNLERVPLQSTQPDVNGESAAAATPNTKRKRKTDHAKRWTGGKGMNAFPWTLQRQSSRDGNAHENNEEDTNDTSPESLSKRFESLLDSLCLQVLTSHMIFENENENDKKDQSPSTSKQVTSNGKAVHAKNPWQLFGSEGRRRQQSKGDKDILQWLCCNIIEPQFSKTLPRQCGIVRGKCFVPGSGSTPAKPSRRVLEAPQLQKSNVRSAISMHRDQERQREMEQERSRSRSLSRVRSPSPALISKPLQQPLRSSSSLAEKWDARTVSVRRKWDRSQSIGPTMREGSQPAIERSISVQPRGISSVAKEVKPLVARKESQTLVMDTPQKGHDMRSSSFSSQSQVQCRSTSSAAASLAAWRRTESQPVLTAGLKKQLSEARTTDDEDGENSISISDSLFFEDSDDEGGFGEPSQPTSRPEEKTVSMPGPCLSHAPSLSHRTEPQSLLSNPSHYSDEEGDELEPVIVAKKRRTLPSSLSFAGIEQQSISAARNPFAVSK